MKLKTIEDLGRDELLGFLQDVSLNWLAHDGLWFQSVEEKFGMGIEAKRIMQRFNPTNGGISMLMQALTFRMYHLINQQDFVEVP